MGFEESNVGVVDSNFDDELKEWRDCYFNKAAKVVNPCDSRLESIKQKNEPVQFYSFVINSVEGITSRLQESEYKLPINVNVTLMDMLYKQFFGRTWQGPSKLLNKGASLKYNESLFFCTPIVCDHVLIVLEISVTLLNGKTKSCGWTAFRPFKAENAKDLRLPLYGGTPRGLLYIDDPFESNRFVKELSGAHVIVSFGKRNKLAAIKKLFPENVLIGRNDRLGGVLDEHNGSNPLERPRFASQFSIIIDDLYIYLFPNVSKFESEFTKLIADDKSFWDKVKIEPSMIAISERRLKIGVHNGWRFIHEPNILHLSVDDPSNKNQSQYAMNKRLSLKSSLKPKASEPDLENNSQAVRLVMRNSLVLNDVIEDPMCAIVFMVEYVINIPISMSVQTTLNKKIVTDSKTQFETHHILVRWGAYCPYEQSRADQLDGRFEINFFGSEVQNPENRLVFARPDTLMQDKQSSMSAPGKITFDIRKGNTINFKPRFDDDIESIDHALPTGLSERRVDTGPYGQLNETQRKSVNDLYNAMVPKQEDNLMSPQANLLMSQIIAKASESQKLVGLFGGNLELYPVYNPSLHMPILALAPGQIGGRTMSRAAYAKLNNANFPPILDRFGKVAEVIDGNSFFQFDLQKEEADMLTCNQICIQFLAFSKTFESMRLSKDSRPRSIYFTFQFYRFPEYKTPSLKLDQIIKDYSNDSSSTPYILRQLEKGSNLINEIPGYMVSYCIDPTNLKFGEKRIFLQYLAHQSMFIDVWDAESLHHIGTATLQLKELLRHSKEAVQSTLELDIIRAEYDDDSRLNSGNTYREGVPYSADSHIQLQGYLHLRIGNIGSPLEDRNDPINQTSLAPALPVNRVIASKSSLNAYGEILLSKKIDEATSQGFISHHMSKAHHMAETFKDIHAALNSQSNKNISDSTNLDPVRKRKLNRMEVVRKMEKNDQNIPPQLISNHRKIIEERKKDLKIMEFYRNQTKHDQILNKLHEFITTEYAIYPNFGIVEFFEFVVTNPYNEAQLITIIIDDPEVQVVSDSREWRHLKLLHQIYSQVEDNMFHRQEIDANKADIKYQQIYLRPKETINIPLKYQTFKANNAVEIDERVGRYNDQPLVRHMPPKYEMKKINVIFRAQDNNPISILRLIVDQQPHVVNQTFRFSEAEHSFLKKTIRLPSSLRALASNSTAVLSGDIKLDGTATDQAVSQIYVRCSDPNVVCESRPVTVGEPHDVFFKVATGVSPNVKKFYIAVYADQYLAVPLQIWQVYVHSLHRIDVSCSQGQTNRFSLILKGTQSSRLVKCYPSAVEEMSILPEDKFMLASNAVQELNVGVQPHKSGVKHYYLNVVDVEMTSLVQCWFISVNCKPPVISKAFELTLAVSSGGTTATLPSHKRVSYTNPYSTEKVFTLSTNRDDLLSFKDRRMRFAANEQKTIALKFLPYPMPGFVEIYVFINNENDTNEETFALRVQYVR